MPHSVDTITTAVRESWTIDTSSSPDQWTEEASARGQCVPSSLVVQDFLGGDIERLATEYEGKRETHYRNVLPDGQVVDVSGDQYPDTQTFEPAPVDDTREYVLANDNTRRRYALLLGRVGDKLALLDTQTVL